MKRIFLIFAVLLSGIYAQAQTIESMRKDIQKSDEEIADPKKNIKVKVWEKRGQLFLDAYQFNTKMLLIGMPDKGLTGAEIIIGKPKSITTDANKETWVYDDIDLIFENKQLAKWVEKNPVTPDALFKAADSYKKAIEIDDKEGGKYKSKSSTMKTLANIRNLFVSKGIDEYSDTKFAEALRSMEGALEMSKFPRDEKSDTTFLENAVNYYAGIIAYNALQYDKAKFFFIKTRDMKFEVPKCYHYLSEISKIQGDTLGSLKILQEGFEKDSESGDLLIDLINHYLSTNDSKSAAGYLDKAIAKDPKNPSLYFAKATLFDRVATDPKTKDEERDANYTSAAELYVKAIEVDQNYYNAYYNLGALYYNKAAKIIELAQKIPPKESKKYDAEMEKANAQFKLAMPYMEKAHEMEPKDKATLQTLSTIYLKLGLIDKQKEAKAKLELMN